MPTSKLYIDGDVYEASCKHQSNGSAELVFTTAYTGYEESVTDPSYYGQALCFAYPLIGNYGFREERTESNSIQPSAVICREATEDFREAVKPTPVFEQVDTRSIVKTVRENGSMPVGFGETVDKARREFENHSWPSNYQDAVTSERRTVLTGSPQVVAVDCGMKDSIVDEFQKRGVGLHVVPYDASVENVFVQDPDLVFISNGPGDPKDFTQAQQIVQEAVERDVPVGGICLGQQIVALVCGGETEKMKFGHRGVNQPVKGDGPVKMTTQNHSYEVADPGSLEVTHRNVNDGSAEGLSGNRILTRQYHPEANPGPHDSLNFFDKLVNYALLK